MKFQSTQPEWAATNIVHDITFANLFQSTQPEWAATGSGSGGGTGRADFNPRSPSGLRPAACQMAGRKPDFNPRSPSGLRPDPNTNIRKLTLFQSTQPEWAATRNAATPTRWVLFQSTQPEWAATGGAKQRGIRSHYFNPRSPSGLRPGTHRQDVFVPVISIHAARVGCDSRPGSRKGQNENFNPRSPSGLRLTRWHFLKHTRLFQSTQPEWAATTSETNAANSATISIHAARVGCDGAAKHAGQCLLKISIHAARVGCDSIRINCNYYSFYSYKSAKLTFLLN